MNVHIQTCMYMYIHECVVHIHSCVYMTYIHTLNVMMYVIVMRVVYMNVSLLVTIYSSPSAIILL